MPKVTVEKHVHVGVGSIIKTCFNGMDGNYIVMAKTKVEEYSIVNLNTGITVDTDTSLDCLIENFANNHTIIEVTDYVSIERGAE